MSNKQHLDLPESEVLHPRAGTLPIPFEYVSSTPLFPHFRQLDHKHKPVLDIL